MYWTYVSKMNSLDGFVWFLYIYLFNLNICQAQETEKRSSASLAYSQNEILNSSNDLFRISEWTFNPNESKINLNMSKNVSSPRPNIVLGLWKTGSVERADFVVIRGPLRGPYHVKNTYGTRNNIMEPNSNENWRLDGAENTKSEQQKY